MNRLEVFKQGLEIGVKTIVGAGAVWVASHAFDGRAPEAVRAEEKPQAFQDLFLEQDVCTQQIAWMKKKDGTLFESKNGCIPKDGTMPHPEGILFLPDVHIK